jgi:nucleoside diphosphate kinase
VIARFHEKGFRIGAHKAYQIARDVMERDVYLYSEIEQSAVRRYLLQPIDSVEQALNKLSVNLSSARVGLMPWASQTIPMMVEEGL